MPAADLMNSLPKVTIAIPVYNGSNYLAEAIDSALGQTYGNLEVLVVNDGSRDGGATERVAMSYGDRIRYISQENTGVGGAMNAAIAHASGDLFSWLSHDDIFLPEKTTEQVEAYLYLGNPDVSLFSDYFLIDGSGAVFQEVRFPQEEFMDTPSIALLRGKVNGCTLMIPTRVLREVGPFDSALKHVQDYDLWNRIQQKYDFIHLPRTLIKYRVHTDQDSKKPDAIVEGNALWIRMAESRSELERVQISGSEKKYFADLAGFLETTPYGEARMHAASRAKAIEAQTLVSVVIPFFNEVPLVVRAVQSVLVQTHANLEIILVDDGSTDPLDEIDNVIRLDPRVRMIHQPNQGPGAARNRGLDEAVGSYIAFLDADDLFLPHKVQRQLGVMQDQGAIISHTSYFVTFPERFGNIAQINSGHFAGSLYPKILGGCSICMPTVMLNRLVIAQGFRFPTETRVSEDVMGWIFLAQRYPFLGITEPLSIVEWAHSSAAINVEKSITGMSFVLDRLVKDEIHSRFTEELARLKHLIDSALEYRKAAYAKGTPVTAIMLYEDLLQEIFESRLP